MSNGPDRAPPPNDGQASDKGSLVALFLIGGLGLVLLILHLTGTLRLQPEVPVPATPAPSSPVAAGGVTDQWLTGTGKENCASTEFIRFDLAGGTATFHNGAGRVTRGGDTLTIAGDGGSIVMRVAYLGPDRMSATVQGGTQTLLRCG